MVTVHVIIMTFWIVIPARFYNGDGQVLMWIADLMMEGLRDTGKFPAT